MADINGIIGYNKSDSSTKKLLAAFGNDIVDLENATGYGLNLTDGNKVEFEVFLDRVFFQNGVDVPRTFNGASWSYDSVERAPISKYIKKFKSRIYLGNCKFAIPNIPASSGKPQIEFPSRVFYSDLPINGDITWGLEWGKSLTLNKNSPFVHPTQGIDGGFMPYPAFIKRNIKVGDPLFITDVNDTAKQNVEKQYTVASVESEYRLKLTENITWNTLSEKNEDTSFWVGSNWFDVGTDDNDTITGFGDNSNRLLIFKLLSLWVYTGSQLLKVNDSPGTPSQRSVINRGGYTYYFHGSDPRISGIYRYDGSTAIKISRAIDPFIQGMDVANYDNVIAWREGEDLRWYIGDLTNTNYNISITNAVATYNIVTGAFDVGPIADDITCSTTWRQTNRERSYCGTSDSQVLQMDDGNSYNGTAIRLKVETKPYYPAGVDLINEYTRIQVIGSNTRGLKVRYKLWDNPNGVDDNYQPLGECKDDRTEFIVPDSHCNAAGISFQLDETGILENNLFVEKIIVFYKPQGRRLYESS